MDVQDYHDVTKVLDLLDAWEQGGGPGGDASLAQQLAGRLGWSSGALRSLFGRWAGGDLNCFVSGLGLAHTRKRLLEIRGRLLCYGPKTMPMAGPFTGSGGLQVRLLPVDQDKGRGKGAQRRGLTLQYGRYASPFGECFLAMVGQEICFLSFIEKGEYQSHRDELARIWPQATIITDDSKSGQQVVARIFALSGEADAHPPLRLLLQGTSFQIRVWQALLALPRGALISYQDLAVCIDRPTACRAVAGAVAANPVAFLIPCHRVIAKSGEIHRYRWGRGRKRAMVGWEACQ